MSSSVKSTSLLGEMNQSPKPNQKLNASAFEFKPSLSLHLKTLTAQEEREKAQAPDKADSWKAGFEVIGSVQAINDEQDVNSCIESSDVVPAKTALTSQEKKSLWKKIDTDKARERWWSKDRTVIEDGEDGGVSDNSNDDSGDDDDPLQQNAKPRRAGSHLHLQPDNTIAFPPHVKTPRPPPSPPPAPPSSNLPVPKNTASRQYKTMKDVLDFVTSLPPHTPLSSIPLPNPLEPTRKQRQRKQLKFKQATSILLSPSLHSTVKIAILNSYLVAKNLPQLLASESNLPGDRLYLTVVDLMIRKSVVPNSWSLLTNILYVCCSAVSSDSDDGPSLGRPQLERLLDWGDSFMRPSEFQNWLKSIPRDVVKGSVVFEVLFVRGGQNTGGGLEYMSNTDLLGWMRRSDKLLRQRCEFRRQRVRVKDEKGREWIESVEQVDRYEFTKEVRLNEEQSDNR